MSVLMRIESIGGGWVGGRGLGWVGGWEGIGVGDGGEWGAVGGLSNHLNRNGSAVPSVGDLD